MVEIYLNAPSGRELPRELLRRALQRLLEREAVREGELSVTFLEDEEIRELNRRYLGHDWVPDVLAFPLHEADPAGHDASGARGSFMGDVYVGLDQSGRQADELGISREEELVRLALHGTLHVLGYDHPEEADGSAASALYRIQEEILGEVLP
jgi:probable rRNA maturation factor